MTQELITELREWRIASAPYEPEYKVPPPDLHLKAADALERMSACYEQERNASDVQAKEIERLTAEKMNLAADIVEIATLRDKLLGDRNAEIERLTAERDSLKEGLDGWHSRYLDAEVERDAAYAAGREAMRQECVKHFDSKGFVEDHGSNFADEIRNLK